MQSIPISILLNIFSLILGICAWFFGIRAMSRPKAMASYRNTVWSFLLCGVSLLLQFWEVRNRVNLGDYAAIEDTIGAVLMASVVLVAVTLVLNLMALIKARSK